MYREQGGACAICFEVKPPIGSGNKNNVLGIDHHHASGHVRKLLCVKCNTIFGMLNEDPTLIRRIADGMISYALEFATKKENPPSVRARRAVEASLL
jgi:hypothetical protein